MNESETQAERLRVAAAMLGKRGGKVKSQAKKIAAQENGKKGGRPRAQIGGWKEQPFTIAREEPDITRIQGTFVIHAHHLGSSARFVICEVWTSSR